MSAEPADDARLDDLESRVAHQDATIDKLNDVVCEQWAVIERLRQEIGRLEQRVMQLNDDEGGDASEVPPHY